MEVLHSTEDPSVNFVVEAGDGGMFESRYVRREARYLTCYLSTHSGCVKACKFCHLTRTGQTTFKHASVEELLLQADRVLAHYESLVSGGGCPAEMVYFSFMARGEPLASRTLLRSGDRLLHELGLRAAQSGLATRHCVSTIMPVEMRSLELTRVFLAERPVIYYSLYSLDPAFRKAWVPQAMDPIRALEKLARWQADTGMLVKIHGAVIKGENDSVTNWERILDAVEALDLHVMFNLVPYNPLDAGHGQPGDLSLIRAVIEARGFPCLEKTRVGRDVKASCGMFVGR